VLDAGAFGGVFDHPALGGEFVADLVGSGEVPGLAGSLAFLGEGDDFRRGFLLDRLDAEDGVDVFPVGQLGCRGLGGEVVGGEFAVGVAHPVEHRGPGGGDIEVIV
ncbi:uncharacterized protein METZ01_LOCUS182359, partial [marine metagenome]